MSYEDQGTGFDSGATGYELQGRAAWPMNDREWARGVVPMASPLRNHIGCNPTACPNGKCQATGECIDIEAQRAEQVRQNRG